MTVYPVIAYRFGNREKHSYLVGVYSTKDLALDAALDEEEGLGGKYGCEVSAVTMDVNVNLFGTQVFGTQDDYKIIRELPRPDLSKKVCQKYHGEIRVWIGFDDE